MMKFMMENGMKGLSKVTESGKEVEENHIQDNGKTVKLMVMECINGRMEIDMKENGKHV